jgi:hypothetical protein
MSFTMSSHGQCCHLQLDSRLKQGSSSYIESRVDLRDRNTDIYVVIDPSAVAAP